MNLENVQKELIAVRREASRISPAVLDPLPYDNSRRNTWVEIENPEFTSLCPKTGLPDYGTIVVRYLPADKIVELKSLKYYFLQFRNTGIFYEQVTQLILDHLVAVLQPLEITVEARFSSRGGLSSHITSGYKRE